MASALRIATKRSAAVLCKMTRPTFARTFSTSWMRLNDNPTDRKYTESHEWFKSENGSFTLGITSHAQEELGNLVYVELPEVGAEIDDGSNIVSLESVKAVSEILSPGNCTVKEVNTSLEANPELVNEDPYHNGWIAKVEGGIDYDSLMTPDAYDNYVKGKKDGD